MKTMQILTIQWRDWDRTVEAFSTHDEARARVEEIARENYPEDDGDTDAFADRGHNWYIDEVALPVVLLGTTGTETVT